MTANELNLDTLSIDEMLDLKDALEVKITEMAKTEAALMTERLARLKSYLPEDPPASDAVAKPTKPKARSRKPAKATSKAKTKATRKTSKPAKVPAKYRDPDSGKTWSGRGMAPAWMREYEKAGRKRVEFEI